MLSLLTLLATPFPFEGPTRASYESAGLVLELPAGWVLLDGNDNMDMSWDFGIRSPNGQLEVRYALRDVREIYAFAEDCQADPDCTGPAPDPRLLLPAMTAATAANISGGAPTMPNELPAELAQAYGAELGYVAATQPKKDWGGGYRGTTVIVLHKDGYELWSFMLFKHWKRARDEAELGIEALTFGG